MGEINKVLITYQGCGVCVGTAVDWVEMVATYWPPQLYKVLVISEN